MDVKKFITKARKLFQEGRWSAAIEKCDEIVPLLLDGDEKADALNIRGAAKDKMGDHAGAIADYDKAIAANSQHTARAYSNRGLAKINSGNYEGAIADFDRSLEINPQNAVALDGRGIAKDRLDKLADFDRSLAINPDNAMAYNNRGFVKLGMGNYEDAIADFNRSIELNPQHAKVYLNLGNAKTKMGDYEGAIDALDHAIEIDPQYAEAYNNLGNAKTKMLDYKGAIDALDHAIEINPRYAEAYYNRGVTKSNMGHHEGAVADYDRVLEFTPGHKKAIHNRAVAMALQASQKGREEIEEKYQAQLQAQQKQFERNMQERLEEWKKRDEADKGLLRSNQYDELVSAYETKFLLHGVGIWLCSLVLIGSAAAVLGTIACVGIIAYFGSPPFPIPYLSFIKEWGETLDTEDFSAFSLLPFILMGTLALSPVAWIIRMLNRDRHKYWVLREDAAANRNLLRIIETGHSKREDLWLQLFDHHDKRGSAHLIADWNRADSTGGNSVSVQDILNLVKPGGGGGTP